MDYLHENKNLFSTIIKKIFDISSYSVFIIEKDYYVTSLLKLLSNKLDYIVFKGGTSLSKTKQVINRFSEDIDISISRKITQGERRKVKQAIIESVNELNLSIENIEEIRSRRDYNLYKIKYDSIFEPNSNIVRNTILLEVVYMSIAYPYEELYINNYFNDYIDNKEIINQYGLQPFKMNVQSLERTFIDKTFAICDYYMLDKKYRNSRHIYDLFKIYPLIKFDSKFNKLVKEIRLLREGFELRPSASKEVNINEVLSEIVESKFYKEDFNVITKTFLNEDITYDEVIKVLTLMISNRIFI